jgi:hypothetical protein
MSSSIKPNLLCALALVELLFLPPSRFFVVLLLSSGLHFSNPLSNFSLKIVAPGVLLFNPFFTPFSAPVIYSLRRGGPWKSGLR